MKQKIINTANEIISILIIILFFAWLMHCYLTDEAGYYKATDKVNADGTHYIYVEE